MNVIPRERIEEGYLERIVGKNQLAGYDIVRYLQLKLAEAFPSDIV